MKVIKGNTIFHAIKGSDREALRKYGLKPIPYATGYCVRVSPTNLVTLMPDEWLLISPTLNLSVTDTLPPLFGELYCNAYRCVSIVTCTEANMRFIPGLKDIGEMFVISTKPLGGQWSFNAQTEDYINKTYVKETL